MRSSSTRAPSDYWKENTRKLPYSQSTGFHQVTKSSPHTRRRLVRESRWSKMPQPIYGGSEYQRERAGGFVSSNGSRKASGGLATTEGANVRLLTSRNMQHRQGGRVGDRRAMNRAAVAGRGSGSITVSVTNKRAMEGVDKIVCRTLNRVSPD